MNESLQNKLSEVRGASNIAYILNDNMDFSVTDYKVMQSHTNSGLLNCAKIMYNGKIKLVYLVEGNRPLSQVVTMLEVNELNAVIFNLLQRAMDIKANGFFRACNIELDFNKIFVDTTDYSVKFIYFPLNSNFLTDKSDFENVFRIALINLFNSFPVFSAPQFQKLCSDLSNGALSLSMIIKKLQNNMNGNFFDRRVDEYDTDSIPVNKYGPQYVPPYTPPMPPTPPTPRVQPPMTITSINSPIQLSLSVAKGEYLIGKNPNMVDGAITYNPAISRVHCKITFLSGCYYVTDMGSANGTYVNDSLLSKDQPVQVRSGDSLKLANSSFVISY